MKQVQEMKLDVKVSMQRIHEDVLKEISSAGDSRNQESKAVKDIGQHLADCNREISSIKNRISFVAKEVHKLQSELDATLVQMANNGNPPTKHPPLNDHTHQACREESKAGQAQEYGLLELSSAIVDAFQPLLFDPTRLFSDDDHVTSKLNSSVDSSGVPTQFKMQSDISPEAEQSQTDSKRLQESAFPGGARCDAADGANPSSSSSSGSSSKPGVSPLSDQDNAPDSSTTPKSNKELAEERRAQLRARRAATESQSSA